MFDLNQSDVFIYSALLIAIAVSCLAVFLAIKISRRLGLVNNSIDQAKDHPVLATPLAGGIALGIALVILSFVFNYWKNPQFSWILIGALIILISGLLEDAHSRFKIPKLAIQLAAGSAVFFSGSYIHLFEGTSLFAGSSAGVYQVLDFLLTLVWVICITNIMNLIDNMDGLAVSLCGITSVFFAIGLIIANQQSFAQFMLCLSGICIVLFIFNMRPALLHMGNSGAMTLGYLLSVFAILYNPLGRSQTASMFLPVLMFGVPVFDSLLIIFSRFRRHQPFFTGGTDHTIHRLVRMGLEPARALTLMVFAAFVLDCLAFVALSLPPKYGYFVFAAYLLSGISLFFYLDRRSFWV